MVAAGRIRTNPEKGDRELAEVVDLGHERGPLVSRFTVSRLACVQSDMDVVGYALANMATELQEVAGRHE